MTDRQTDRRVDTFLATRPHCIQYSAVKSSLVVLETVVLVSRSLETEIMRFWCWSWS